MKAITYLPVVILSISLLFGCTLPGNDSNISGDQNTFDANIFDDANDVVPDNNVIPDDLNTLVIDDTNPPEQTKGTADSDFKITMDDWKKTEWGTTLFADNHTSGKPRIVEVNMKGEIIWEYKIPQALTGYTNPGFDAEVLPSNNVLFLLPRNGVYEINRKGETVWSFKDSKVSHDADRLANGNTLIAYGAMDKPEDMQVREIDKSGKIVWSWKANDYFNTPEYRSINSEGWTHTNGVERLANGNTRISLRNFNFIVEVDKTGKIVKKIGEGLLTEQHDPETLSNGNMILADHAKPQSIMELDTNNKIVWQFMMTDVTDFPARDADRLPNGNTLITTSRRLIEVTPGKKIVWELKLTTAAFTQQESASLGFFKAQRILANSAATQPDDDSTSDTETEVKFEGKYIDVHAHVVLQDMTLEEIIQGMDNEGIDTMVIMEAPTKIYEGLPQSYFGIPAAAETYPDRFVTLYGGEAITLLDTVVERGSHTDAEEANYKTLLDDAMKTGKYKGFGEIALRHVGISGSDGANITVPGDHPWMLILADVAAKYDTPIDIHLDIESGENGIAGLEKLLDHNTNAKIIWSHLAWSRTNFTSAAAEQMRTLLEKHPNLYSSIKIQSDVAFLDSSDNIEPEWMQLFKDYPDRFMIGSDIKPAQRSQDWMFVANHRDFLAQLPSNILKPIERENAIRLYKIKE
ncbi:MAG: aryl-sulfate sulfotransferase [archaeon]